MRRSFLDCRRPKQLRDSENSQIGEDSRQFYPKGKAGIGVLGKSEITLPLSFPVKGKDEEVVVGRLVGRAYEFATHAVRIDGVSCMTGCQDSPRSRVV